MEFSSAIYRGDPCPEFSFSFKSEEKIFAGDPGIGAWLSPRRCGKPGHLLLRGRRLYGGKMAEKSGKL